MNRLVAVAGAVVVAAGITLVIASSHGSDAGVVAAVEKRLTSGDLQGARAEIDAARSRLDPGTRDYLDGLVLVAGKQDAAALPLLERAAASRPSDWRCVTALAAAQANTGRFALARHALEAFLRANGEDERALALYAEIVLDSRDPARDPVLALSLLKRLDALPSRAEAGRSEVDENRVRRIRVRAEAEAGHAEAAYTAAQKAAQAHPGDAETWFVVGEAARRAKRTEECAAAFRKAVALDESSRRYLEQLVMVLLEYEGPGDEMVDRSERLLAMGPQDPALLVLRARTFAHRGKSNDLDQADAIYRALLKRQDVPQSIRRDVLRNEAVLLYDWKQGGREGAYLKEAHALLQQYRALGGEIDAALRDVWEQLEKSYGGGAAPPEKR